MPSGSSSNLALKGVLRGAEIQARAEIDRDAEEPWAPPGRIVELCAGADVSQTSAVVMVLREVQAQGDPVLWVIRHEPEQKSAGIFPPDLAAAGIDLDALVVVHVPPQDPRAGLRAAELGLRAGAFGAVVLDLTASSGALASDASRPDPRRREGPSMSASSRLLGLAREHDCRVIVLSPYDHTEVSLGPLVSLRFDVRRQRTEPGRFRLEANVVKDKSGLFGARASQGGRERSVKADRTAPEGVR